MSRLCDLSQKKVMFGRNVSHANNKTKRTFLPNVQETWMESSILNKKVKLKLSTNGMRTLYKHGGLDSFLKSTPITRLSPTMAALKKQINKVHKASSHRSTAE